MLLVKSSGVAISERGYQVARIPVNHNKKERKIIFDWCDSLKPLIGQKLVCLAPRIFASFSFTYENEVFVYCQSNENNIV